MTRRFTTFVGVDLGGARGKTTAVAQLRRGEDGRAWVHAVSTRHRGEPWVDDTLLGFVEELGDDVVVAIDAPLTSPACGRCTVAVCPGVEACVDPAVVWLRSEGRELTEEATVAEGVVGGGGHGHGHGSHSITRPSARSRLRVQPYAHRCTELVVCYERGLVPPSSVGGAVGLVAHRAAHLRRRLVRAGFELHQNLIEVSPAATIAALFDRRRARGYKRDADPWETRAEIIETLDDLEFAPSSRLAREDVLRNDHCFDAVIDAYTAYLWARDGWQMPEGPYVEDGWIWTPPAPHARKR